MIGLLLTACVGRDAPPLPAWHPIHAVEDGKGAEETSMVYQVKLVAGCWGKPVSIEYSVQMGHLAYADSGHWRATTKVEQKPPSSYPDFEAGLRATIRAFNEAQEVYPYSKHVRFALDYVGGNLVVLPAEVLQPDGSWGRPDRLLDPVLSLDTEGNCKDILNQIYTKALEKRSDAFHGGVLIDSRRFPAAVMASCTVRGQKTAREHVFSILGQLERQTGEPWYYRSFAKLYPPAALCNPGYSDDDNRAELCNQYLINVQPLLSEERTFEITLEEAMKRDPEHVPPRCIERSPSRPPFFLPAKK